MQSEQDAREIAPKWNDGHEHEWRIEPGDWDAAEGIALVECVKCGVPGERTDKSGEVYWPAT